MVINQPTSTSPGLNPPNNTGFVIPVSDENNDPDQLVNLLELRYAGVPFPCTHFMENGSQDLAIHKYPNLDSARVELTGRNPSTFSCRAVLTNNIFPSTKETWVAGTLFPQTFTSLLNHLYDSSDYHVLQHPFLGFINVVPVKWDYSFIGSGPRDGVYLDIIWIETIGDENLNVTISAPSSLVSQATGSSIDTAMSATALLPMNPPGLTVGELFSKVAGVIRNAVAFPQQLIAPINAQVIQMNSNLQGAGSAIASSPAQLFQYSQAVVNQNKGLTLHGPVSNAYYYNKSALAPVFTFSQDALLEVLQTLLALNGASYNSADQLTNNAIAHTDALINYYQSLHRVETANVVFLLYQFLGQLQQTSANLFNNNRNWKVNTYTVKVPTSLFALSKILNNTTDQMIQLNSQLNKIYMIPEGTIIKYYQGT